MGRGTGRDYFAKVVAAGQEGLVAKRLSSPYVPGQRGSAWRKIKPLWELPCVVVGYRQGPRGLKDLLLAAVRDGALRYVGTLDLGAAAGRELLPWLIARQRQKPVVPCPLEARWVEPTKICKVRFLQAYSVERTKLEARKKGYLATEQELQDGSIQVRLTLA